MFYGALLLLIVSTLLNGAEMPRRAGMPGAFPAPSKGRGVLAARGLRRSKEAVLDSSRKAVIVTERRHVHQDWCKSHPFNQTLRENGCVSRTVINRFCYGQCNSFYIPGSPPFRSCSFCKPKRFVSVTIILNCPALQPPSRHRRVQLVKECRCVSISLDMGR
eukprot:gi/632984668/ref/XP_007909254.1/ PREDICTED: gremlin-1-like [Callorhinchus milii]